MGTFKDAYDTIKEIANDIKNISDKTKANEFYSKLLDVQESILEANQENIRLVEENTRLNYELVNVRKDNLPKNIRWSTGGIGYYKDDFGDNYVCRFCYDEHHKIYHVKACGLPRCECTKCNRAYYYFTNK